MKRRHLLLTLGTLPLLSLLSIRLFSRDENRTSGVKKITRNEEEWRKFLSREQFHILREEATQ